MLSKTIFALTIFLTSTAFANSPYTCKTKAAPDSGFPIALVLSAESETAGATVTKNSKPFGKIRLVDSLDLQNPNEQNAAIMVLQYVGSEEGSGIKDISQVQTIQRDMIDDGNPESEIIVYRFFDATKKQIGGTLWYNALATACLP